MTLQLGFKEVHAYLMNTWKKHLTVVKPYLCLAWSKLPERKARRSCSQGKGVAGVNRALPRNRLRASWELTSRDRKTDQQRWSFSRRVLDSLLKKVEEAFFWQQQSQTFILMGDFNQPSICHEGNMTGCEKCRFLEFVEDNFFIQAIN